jgi:hypothetical protein
LTRRPGTTTTFLGAAPSANLTKASLASAMASMAALSARPAQDGAAQLAVDLQHQLDLVLHQRRLVHLRPGGVEQIAQRAGVAQLGPQAVRDVRRGGVEQRSRMPKPSISATWAPAQSGP